MKPWPSVLLPWRAPDSLTTIVFTAPMRRAASSASSTASRAARLCGTVTLAPTKPSLPRQRSASAKSSGATASGT